MIMTVRGGETLLHIIQNFSNYTAFGLYKLNENKDYDQWRAILNSPTHLFYCSIVLVLAIYCDFLRNFLVY